jgi:galactokinase
MKNNILSKFKELFDQEDPIVIASPGRINLIGEHTDYNEGYVLPAAIDKRMYVAAERNNSSICSVYSLDFNEKIKFDLASLRPNQGHWSTYITGVFFQFKEAGYPISGVNFVFGGDIPIGAGLSSSAALECSIAYMLACLFDLKISRMEMVMHAQKAEHDFAGVECGIMDQFASMMGKKDHVIKLDCRTMAFEHFPLKLSGHSLLLVDSRVKHALADSAYNTRKMECQSGVIAAQNLFPEVKSLRDLTLTQVSALKDKVPLNVFNRCKYVVEENERVLKATEAVEKNNFKELGKLLFSSHQGLSELYEVSCPELDFLVEFTKDYYAVLGSRMMGGGFGGCTLNLLKKEKVEEFKENISESYLKKFGKSPEFYDILIEDGTLKV